MKSGILAAEAIFPKVTAENLDSETAGVELQLKHSGLIHFCSL